MGKGGLRTLQPTGDPGDGGTTKAHGPSGRGPLGGSWAQKQRAGDRDWGPRSVGRLQLAGPLEGLSWGRGKVTRAQGGPCIRQGGALRKGVSEAGQWGSCGADSRWRGQAQTRKQQEAWMLPVSAVCKEVAPFLGHQKPRGVLATSRLCLLTLLLPRHLLSPDSGGNSVKQVGLALLPRTGEGTHPG